jgi:hypothetical protein
MPSTLHLSVVNKTENCPPSRYAKGGRAATFGLRKANALNTSTLTVEQRKSVQVTIDTYGADFGIANAVAAMETWPDTWQQ